VSCVPHKSRSSSSDANGGMFCERFVVQCPFLLCHISCGYHSIRFFRIVNTTINLQPVDVLSRAKYRSSDWENLGSGNVSKDSCKNVSSISVQSPLCDTRFLPDSHRSPRSLPCSIRRSMPRDSHDIQFSLHGVRECRLPNKRLRRRKCREWGSESGSTHLESHGNHKSRSAQKGRQRTERSISRR
jgi:hypothetical protein